MDGRINPALEGSEIPHEPQTAADGAVHDGTKLTRTVKVYLGVCGCLLESVVLAGSIFGWASMVYVLQVRVVLYILFMYLWHLQIIFCTN